MDLKSKIIRYLLLILTFITLEAASIFLITKNSVVQKYKFMHAIREINVFFWEFNTNVKYYFSLKESNEELINNNIELLNKIEVLESMIEQDSVPLKMGKDRALFSYISAKIISNSTNKQHNFITINKGSNDGIKLDMGVITDNGIIGYVTSVSNNFSQVSSFLNVDGSISAIIKKNNTFGPLRWHGKNTTTATLYDIPVHTDFSVGDTIVSSGFSLIYPPSIPIGVIEGYSQTDGINYNLTIKLFEDFKSLKYVYVISNLNIEELSTIRKNNEGLER